MNNQTLTGRDAQKLAEFNMMSVRDRLFDIEVILEREQITFREFTFLHEILGKGLVRVTELSTNSLEIAKAFGRHLCELRLVCNRKGRGAKYPESFAITENGSECVRKILAEIIRIPDDDAPQG